MFYLVAHFRLEKQNLDFFLLQDRINLKKQAQEYFHLDIQNVLFSIK